MKEREISPRHERFREGSLKKKTAIIVIETAAGLLLTALALKYGKTLVGEIKQKVTELEEVKEATKEAIETDDVGIAQGRPSAATLAQRFANLFIELSKDTDLDWRERAVQFIHYLPGLLDHQGPSQG